MTIDRLGTVLSAIGPPAPADEGAAGPPVTARELAEILWLAAHIAERRPDTAAPTQETPAQANAAALPPEPHSDSGDVPPAVRSEPEPTETAPDDHGLYPPSPGTGPDGEGTGATGVLVPTAPMLDHPLAIQRALRPFKRRVPSHRARTLDEAATAARIADQPAGTRPWVPVMTAAAERWLSLTLVIDVSPSMRMWRPLTRDLHEALIRLGAFRDLRVRYLTAAGREFGIATSPKAPPRDVTTVVDPSGRQVVLVLSDCSGPHWWDGRAGLAVRTWARAGPAAILQPLTERLWRRTAAPVVPGSAVTTRPCAPNGALRFTPYDGAPGPRPGAVPVPVLECAPGWFGDWAALVSGGGGARPAAMTYAGPRGRGGAEPLRQERELPIRQRVQRFQTTASPEAARLAAHLAVSFPALPVMRLIQQRVLRDQRPGHLAEVLLSGLLRTLDADSGWYDFVPGAREALLTTLPRSAAWHTADVLGRISDEIERRAGTAAETFRAYLSTGGRAGERAIGPDGRPFALVNAEAVQLLSRTTTLRPPTEPGPRPLGDRYLLDERIGGGATGQLWAGRRREDGSQVAVKLLHGEFVNDPQEASRLLRQGAAISGLRHPNVVRIHDLIVEGDVVGIVMDLVNGIDLRQVMADGRLPLADAATLLAQVANALAAVHKAEVVHGSDVPENIFVVERSGGGRTALLAGFGTASTIEEPTWEHLRGHLAYLAPESFAGEAYEPWSDVYSLGVIAYELFTGRLPFTAPTFAGMLRAHLEQPVLRPDDIGDAAWSLIAECLAKDPAARPSAAEAARRWAVLALGSGEQPRDHTGEGDQNMAGPVDAWPTEPVRLLDLLGNPDPLWIDLAAAWERRTARDFLRIVFGADPQRRPVTLDLKEAAQGGMGPHGLLAWSADSGKSELIRTLILGLALTHSPEDLNFLLIGFPSGVTVRGFSVLPHVSDIVTDPFGGARQLIDALQGELSRRQELLRTAGDFRSHREYEEARADGAGLEPLPALVVLVDEVFELLRGRPQFADVLTGIGWKGRALGVHLLLVTQNIDRAALRQLEHFLSYRICLRVRSRTDSEAVLGTADAAHLPRLPGAGYLMTGPSTYQPFRAAYTADDADAIIERLSAGRPLARRLLPRTLVDPPALKQPRADDEPGRFDRPLTFDRLRTLDRLLPGLSVTPSRGLTADRPGALSAVVGVVRRPDGEGRPLWLDLAVHHGNVVVVGAQRSGKSRFLCTLVASLALLHTPSEVQFHCLDFGGGLLTGFADLPHVGSVATERDTGPARHIVTGVARLLEERDLGATGPEVFLVVDRWRTVRRDLPDLIPVITDLAARGPSYGIRVLLSARAWADLPDDLRDHFGVRLELRLEDPTDSLVDAGKAADVPHRSGRGLLANGDHFFAALPRIDGQSTFTELARGVAHLVRLVGAAWQGASAPSLDASAPAGAEAPFVVSEPPPDDDTVTAGGQAATTRSPVGSPADGAAAGHGEEQGAFDIRQPWVSGRRELSHPESVLALDFSPDGRLLATGCRDGNVRLWDRSTGDRLRILEQPSAVREVLFHPDGRLLITSCADGLVRCWDLRSGVVRELFEVQQEGGAIALAPDGGLLAACTPSSPVQLWDMSEDRSVRPSLLGGAGGGFAGHTKPPTALAFSPDGRLLASAGADKTVLVWDVATGRAEWVISVDVRALTGITFSPDGHLLVTASGDGAFRSGSVRLWSTAAKRMARVLGTGGASAVSFHPDGRILATATNSAVGFWDVTTGESITRQVSLPKGRNRAVVFSPDGRTVAVAGEQVFLWDLSVAPRG